MILKSLISAFSMYSRIPMPQIEWKEENRRYALCFFPLIGAVIDIILMFWQKVCIYFNVSSLLFAAVCTVIPIAVTGGIHADGFCDVSDARASCADREKALEIMQDSRVGAFAVISLAVYILLQTAFFAEISENIRAVTAAAAGFVLSRSLSGLAAVTFRSAKKAGTLQSFSEPAHKKITIAVLAAAAVICLCVMLAADILYGAAGIVGAALSFAYYRRFSYRRFGGITGDLAGYFLQICELSVLAFITAAAVITD